MKNVVIIGAGPTGLFAAYNLATRVKDKVKITVLDKGNNIYSRNCPMREGKPCVHCKPCNIMCGFGGAGTFSDCKLSLSPYGVGGDIVDYIGGPKAEDYVHQVNDIFTWFDKDALKRKIIGLKNNTYEMLENKLANAGLSLTYCPTKHLGTDGTLAVMKLMYEYLVSNGVEFTFRADVYNFNKTDVYYDYKNLNKNSIKYDYLIFAVGRSGNEWLGKVMRDHNVKTQSKKFDIGFRVEVPYEVVSELTDNLYDMKISKTYDDGIKVRTFCTNPRGYVSEEHYRDNIALANGHSYADKKSNNTNFAVLVTLPIDTKEGMKIVESYANAINGGIAVNSFRDFDMASDYGLKLEPTLKTAKTEYDIYSYLPKEVTEHFIQFMYDLDKAYFGVVSDKTNVYGIEAKFYSDTIEVNDNFETSIPNVYCVGDGSGITRGIVQSGCSGLVVSDDIITKL